MQDLILTDVHVMHYHRHVYQFHLTTLKIAKSLLTNLSFIITNHYIKKQVKVYYRKTRGKQHMII